MDLFTSQPPYTFHEAQATRPVYVPPYAAPALELTLLLEGSIRFLIDGKERIVEGPSATMSVCRRSLGVQVDARRKTHSLWCNCRGVRLSEARWQWLEHQPAILPLSERLVALFQSGFTTPTAPERVAEPFAAQVRQALGTALFGEYFRQAGTTLPSLPLRVQAVKQHIDQHFNEACNSDSLAQIAGVHPAHLTRLFAQHIGDTPVNYLWNRRLIAGKTLLESTDLSIEDIAACCGFRTAAHFSRRMKARFGTPPGALRRLETTEHRRRSAR